MSVAGRPDVLVVGGGPAGLAVAIGSRLAGLTATVVERKTPPIDKACGEGLMPDGVAALARLGIDPDELGGRPFRGIRYLDDDGTEARGEFPGGAAAGGGAGLGLRRTRLHAALVRRAEEVGVETRWGTVVQGLMRDGGEGRDGEGELREPGGDRTGAAAGGERFAVATDEGPVAGRWLVAADGLLSPLRRQAHLEGRPAPRRRFGVRRHYRLAPWSDCVEVWWTRGWEAYVTPVAADEVGVAMLWSPDEVDPTPTPDPASAPGTAMSSDQLPASAPGTAISRDQLSAPGTATSSDPSTAPGDPAFDRLLAAFPRLAARLAGAPAVSRDRGAGPLAQRPRGVHRGNLALVGDAAGYLDAITGEGLAFAFHQAEALVAAIRAGDLAAYARAHRRLCRLPDALTSLLLAVERHPRLRRRMIRALAAEPALFSRLLGVHARSLPVADFGLRGAARLVWGLARA